VRLWIGILIGGILAVTSPYAATWFAHAWAWVQTAMPEVFNIIKGVTGK